MIDEATAPLDISLYERLREVLPNVNTISCTKMTLVHLSHALENMVLNHRLPALIFTGFQESSHWRKETERYLELTQVAHQVCIFAGRPLPPESEANQIHVELAEGDALRQEWFLLVMSEPFSALLCGQDRNLMGRNEANREFETIWSFDPAAINQALDMLDRTIAHYRPERLNQLRDARRRFPPSQPDDRLLSEFMVQMVAFEEQLNRELREQQQMVDNVLAAITHYVYVIDVYDGGERLRVRYSSPNFDAITGGYSTARTVDELLYENIHEDDIAIYRNLVASESLVGLHMFTTRVRRADGDYLWVENTMRGVQQADGQSITVYGVMRDITERYLLEEAEREKAFLQRELERERELSAIKTYFMNTVSHEFRTPLSTILSSSELLERYGDRYSTEERAYRLKHIQAQVLHLAHMLDDMSIILNGQIAALGLHPDVRDVRSLFQELVAYATEAFAAGHILRVTYADNLGEAPLDGRMVTHIFNNVVVNAVKYSRPDSPVDIAISRTDAAIVLVVEDSGIGILPEDEQHIFETMYRGRNTQSIAGAGMGLRIVAECARIHQADVRFTSEPGEGTRFEVYFPLDLDTTSG